MLLPQPSRAPNIPDLPLAPSNRQFLELPIAVQSQWESYRDVSLALQNLAFAGWYQQAALLADATYTDDRMVAVLNTRANGLFSLPMRFRYQGEGEGRSVDSPAVQQLKQSVVRLVEDRWEEIFPAATLREMLRWGILLNAGIGELVWRWDDDLLLPTLKIWNPQFIYWRWDTRSNWLIHTGGQVELHPGDSRWVHYAPFGHNHGQLYGLIRSIGYLYLDRVFTFRNWSRVIEKFSVGIMKAKIPADGNAEDKAAFAAAVTNMPHEATVILPITKAGNSFDIDMLRTDQTVYSDTFRQRVQQLDESIAILVLGQNLTTQAGGAGAAGSRAAASVHDEIRKDLVRADAEVLASTLKSQVLAPFVWFNFATKAARAGIPWQVLVPNVTWDLEPPEDRKLLADMVSQVATAMQAFQQAGAPIDVRALAEKFEIPIVSERRAPNPPPGGNVNERPRLPDLMPTDLPSPDYREYQQERPTGARPDSSMYEEPQQQFVGVEGADQFGNPVGPRTDPSGNEVLPARPTSGPGTDGRGLYPIASGNMPGGRLLPGPESANGSDAQERAAPEQAEAERPPLSGRPKTGLQVSAIAAFDERGRVLLIRRRDDGKWCFPGGHVLPGEDPHQTARRELREETGLDGERFVFLGSRPGENGKRVFAYTCQVFGQPDASRDPDNEAAQFMWANPSAMPALAWHNDHDVLRDWLRSREADRYGEHPNGGSTPQGASPDFRDDKAQVTYQDDKAPLYSQFRRQMLARDLPSGALHGQIVLDDLIAQVTPEVGRILAAERGALIKIAKGATSYDDLRQKIRSHFRAVNPAALREIFGRALVIAEVLGGASTRP